MVQRCEQMRLAIEPREAIGIGGEDRRKDLDGDVTSERRIPRTIDLAHPSCAERRQELVRTVASCRLCEHFNGRAFSKAAGLAVSGEERLDFSPERAIDAARFLEKCLALERLAFTDRLKELLDSIPARIACHSARRFGFPVIRR